MKHVVRKKVYACVHKFPQNIYICAHWVPVRASTFRICMRPPCGGRRRPIQNDAHWVPVRTVQTLGAEASVLVDIVLSELADAFGTVVSVSDIN